MLERVLATAHLPFWPARLGDRGHAGCAPRRQSGEVRFALDQQTVPSFSSFRTFWLNCVKSVASCWLIADDPLLGRRRRASRPARTKLV